MATCKTAHRNDCWITRSAREGDSEDKVNNSPNFLRVNKSLNRVENRDSQWTVQVQVQVQVHLFTLIQLQYNNNKKKKVKTELTIH